MAGCCGHDAKFDGVSDDYKKRLWIVIAINAVMFGVEMVAGQLAGSQALQADALDFLGDALTYGISLAVIGASVRVRTNAALAKGISLLLMGAWVFAATLYRIYNGAMPDAPALPDGGTSTYDQMVEGMGTVKSYQEALVAYRECLTPKMEAAVAAAQAEGAPDELKAAAQALQDAYNASVTAEEELAVAYGDEKLEIGFNAKYLLEIASQVDRENAVFMFSSPAEPTLMREGNDESAIYVVMPMRV